MKLQEFNSLIGQNSYVRCAGKKRMDSAIVDVELAAKHLFSGGQIGWWVKPGYIIVDIDEGKQQAINIVKKLHLKTLMCQTPHGLHLYFKCNETYQQKVGMVLPCGLRADYRCANKGYVLLPFGEKNRRFNKIRTISEMPREFTPIPNRKESLLGLVEGEGRNATLFAHLMAYKNHGADEDQVEQMAHIINDDIFDTPLEDSELEKIIKNTRKYKAADQGENPYIIYNSKGFPSQVNSRAIGDYFVNEGKIFVLGGECYEYQDGVYTEASSKVRNTIRDMIACDNLITQPKIVETFKLITDDTRIQRNSSEINQFKSLINFKNGIWDIGNKALIPHDSKYLQTIQIPHNVNKPVPFKQTHLYDFFKKTKLDHENIMMILKYMAYCMTLDNGLKTFVILCGQSNTGKSVLIRFLENLVGRQNVSSLSMHELNMRFYPAQLYNRLVNSCADNSSLPLSSIENLKKITGGDQIMHEKKGKEPFFFTSFAKLIFSFNQLPLQLEEKSNAFYKRMRILYMNTELFLDNDYVNELCSDESIEEVIPYLLHLLPLKSIPRTPKSDDLVESLRQDSDSVHAFITKLCILTPNAIVGKDTLYDAYANFCINSGREAHKKHSFMRSIKSAGFSECRNKYKEYCWRGIELKKQKRGRYK